MTHKISMRKLNKTSRNSLEDSTSILIHLNYLEIIVIIFIKDHDLAIDSRAQLKAYYNYY